MDEEKERIIKLITDNKQWNDQSQDGVSGVDYAAEYKKQTGKDFETGQYITQ